MLRWHRHTELIQERNIVFEFRNFLFVVSAENHYTEIPMSLFPRASHWAFLLLLFFVRIVSSSTTVSFCLLSFDLFFFLFHFSPHFVCVYFTVDHIRRLFSSLLFRWLQKSRRASHALTDSESVPGDTLANKFFSFLFLLLLSLAPCPRPCRLSLSFPFHSFRTRDREREKDLVCWVCVDSHFRFTFNRILESCFCPFAYLVLFFLFVSFESLHHRSLHFPCTSRSSAVNSNGELSSRSSFKLCENIWLWFICPFSTFSALAQWAHKQ